MQIVGCFALGAYVAAQFIAAIWGLETYIGWLAVPVIVGSLYFRFSLPVTVFAFLGAKNDWGWHWLAALVFVAPGLLLIVPAILSSAIEQASNVIKQRRT